MAIPPLRDLSPKGDVKGGSPRTPSGGVRVAEYQQFVESGNESAIWFWRTVATGSMSLLVGMTIAWWSALQGKGITEKDMQEFVTQFFGSERRIISEHTSQQDGYIGVLQGKQDKTSELISEIKSTQRDHDKDLTEIREKLKLTANYLEEQQKVKK